MRISTVPRLTRPRLALAGASVAIAGTLLGAGLAGSATAATASGHTPSASASTAPKPTIVLVHGAWANSSSWNAVVEQLQALGYTVDAPPNPLRGVSSDSAYLADFLSTISGPIVLVGHSYGGFVITNAATGNTQVKALVYDDAFIPASGDTTHSLTAAKPGLLRSRRKAKRKSFSKLSRNSRLFQFQTSSRTRCGLPSFKCACRRASSADMPRAMFSSTWQARWA